jgi:hypothetical protein
MPKKKATARPKEKPKPLRSEFYNYHPASILPKIHAVLKKFYGTERMNGRKPIPALKGRELEAKVNRQMRFLHPGMK